LSRFDKAFETGRKAYDEGQAILEEVCSGEVIEDDIMGDETAHLKRAAMQMHATNDNIRKDKKRRKVGCRCYFYFNTRPD
jgi:hypothetical protein